MLLKKFVSLILRVTIFKGQRKKKIFLNDFFVMFFLYNILNIILDLRKKFSWKSKIHCINTVKLPNLMRTRNSFRFDSKISAKRKRTFSFFLIFFQIRFGRIELAIYSNKALDSIDLMQKRILTRIMKFWKKIKNSKFVRHKFSLAFGSVRSDFEHQFKNNIYFENLFLSCGSYIFLWNFLRTSIFKFLFEKILVLKKNSSL